MFTAPGFDGPGRAVTLDGREDDKNSKLHIVARDRATAQPTPCRMVVVGPDGNFFQAAENRLNQFSLIGRWPDGGLGNRKGKAPTDIWAISSIPPEKSLLSFRLVMFAYRCGRGLNTPCSNSRRA
jgi:hypothetical protein